MRIFFYRSLFITYEHVEHKVIFIVLAPFLTVDLLIWDSSLALCCHLVATHSMTPLYTCTETHLLWCVVSAYHILHIINCAFRGQLHPLAAWTRFVMVQIFTLLQKYYSENINAEKLQQQCWGDCFPWNELWHHGGRYEDCYYVSWSYLQPFWAKWLNLTVL